MKLFLSLSTIVVLFLSSCIDDEPLDLAVTIESNIVSKTTWERGKTYVINEDITISDTLVIEPGVIVKLNAALILDNAHVEALGTMEESIVFTSIHDDELGEVVQSSVEKSAEPGDWKGVSLRGAGTNAIFNNCYFRYANTAMHIIEVGNICINECTFHDNGVDGDKFGGGIDAKYARTSKKIEIRNSSFYNNTLPLVMSEFVELDSLNKFKVDENYNFCQFVKIVTTGAYSVKNNTIVKKDTLKLFDMGIPYFIERMNIDHLTISPGVNIFVSESLGVGTLDARGSSAARIVFRSSYALREKRPYVDQVFRNWSGIGVSWLQTESTNCINYCDFYDISGRSCVDIRGAYNVSDTRFFNCSADFIKGGAVLVLNGSKAVEPLRNILFIDCLSELSIYGSLEFSINQGDVEGREGLVNASKGINTYLYCDEIKGDVVLENTGTILLLNDMRIPEGSSLNLKSITLKVGVDKKLVYNGDNLTYDENCLFTSIFDDTNGDSNLDLHFSKPYPGAWQGIYNNSTESWEDWKNIKYALWP